MKRGGPLQALTSSPTMVGAITTLIVVVAVFLAYNANNGLPFVQTYRLTAQVPDANGLVKGNEVRIGGVRVHGGTSRLRRILEDVEPDEVLIAIPSAPGTLRAQVVTAARSRGIPVRTLPTVFELLQSGATAVRQVRDVQIEDILGREPVRMEVERVGDQHRCGTVALERRAGSGWIGDRDDGKRLACHGLTVLRERRGTAEVDGVDGVLRIQGFTPVGGNIPRM